jgi:hypothetical protein
MHELKFTSMNRDYSCFNWSDKIQKTGEKDLRELNPVWIAASTVSI